MTLESGASGWAAVPSGASTGEFEAVELRDGGERVGRQGRVGKAVANVNGEIAEALTGARAADQSALDRTMIELDGTPNKGRLGANAILGVSLAAAKAAAADSELPLYRYLGELYAAPESAGGGEPTGAAGADDERPQRRRPRRQLGRLPGVHGRPGGRLRASPSACGWGPRSSTRSRRTLHDKGLSTAVGDEGGFAPDLDSNEAALEMLVAGIEAAGLKPGAGRADRPRSGHQRDLRATAPTCSSTRTARSPPRRWSTTGRHLVERYPIVSIEDGMDEEDWDGWKLLTERLGERCQLVGDDLFVTNPERLRAGHRARRRQLDPGQGQPDRHPDRDPGGDPHRPRGRLHRGHLPPLRRDRGHDHRRPRRRHRRRPDQDRRALPLGPRRQVQPAAAHRGGAGRPALSSRARRRSTRILSQGARLGDRVWHRAGRLLRAGAGADWPCSRPPLRRAQGAETIGTKTLGGRGCSATASARSARSRARRRVRQSHTARRPDSETPTA